MATNIVIPVKPFGAAKQRLSSVLCDADRVQLARHLCQHTLAFLARHVPDHHVLVVTPSEAAAEMASIHGASVLMEPVAAGLSVAADRAAAWSATQGFDAQLLLPTDIARLDPDEVQRLLRRPRRRAFVSICPAKDAGTNALLTMPPAVIPFRFGPHSSEAHRAAAISRGVRHQLLYLRHMSVDVDTTRDLTYLTQHGRRACTDTLQEA